MKPRFVLLSGRALLASSFLVLAFALTVGAPAGADAPIDVPQAPPLPIQEEPTLLQKTGDAVFVRPLLAVRFVFNVVTFPIVWPVGAVLGDDEWAFDVCFRDPADRLFQRPLGRL